MGIFPPRKKSRIDLICCNLCGSAAALRKVTQVT
jgi:hypothetical protein